MTKSELTQILAILRSNYPMVKIDNPKTMVETWFLTLGEFSGEAVLESAKCHMAHSKFFPTPAELRENIVRHKIITNQPRPKALEAGKKAKVTAIPDGISEDEWLDLFIAEQVKWEEEMFGKDFLDFER